jgi:ribose transport system permease protein
VKKVLGILGLLVAIVLVTALFAPGFLSPYNVQNLVRWTALFGILSIGVVFPIVSGGIDLSIGSVVGLVGCVMPWLLVERGMGILATLAIVLALSLAIGCAHGLLVTRIRIQPFVVTLCGLLFYRGVARWIAGDQTLGFGNAYDGSLRLLATGKPCTLAELAVAVGALAGAWGAWTRFSARRAGATSAFGASRLALPGGLAVAALGTLLWTLDPWSLGEIRAPMPFLILLCVALGASVLLNGTVWGRHLQALGRNETAARYSGIDVRRVVLLSYVLCSGLAGVGGVLFALDINSIQPAAHGNFYELYAIAAAVLGGCSLRGGEGSILGVVIGAAVMRVLYNSINLLAIPTQLEFAIIGLVILLGVVADELIRRAVTRRREQA